MARTYQYLRPVDAVLTSIDLGNKTYPSENGIKIKEEPPDFDDPIVSLTDPDTVVESVSANGVRRRSNIVNIETNECNLIREPVGSGKNDSKASRKRRKRHLNDDPQWVVRKRKRKGPPEMKDVPSKDMPPKDIPSKDMPSKDIASKDMAPKDSADESKHEVVCDVCFVPFFSKTKLIQHTQRYRTLMVCDYCKAPFNLRSTLYRHQLVHSRKSGSAHKAKLKCHFCERRFDNKERVQMHLFHCHGSTMQTKCDGNESETDTLTKDASMPVTSDMDEVTHTKIAVIDNAEENTHRMDSAVHVINDAQGHTRQNDATESVINNAEENAREEDITSETNSCVEEIVKSTCAVMECEEPVEDISAHETTVILDHVDQMARNTLMEDTRTGSMDNAGADMCVQETIILISSDDEAEKDMSMDDTIILVQSDCNKLKETRTIDTNIEVSKNVEENTHVVDMNIGASKNIEENTHVVDANIGVSKNVEENTHVVDTNIVVSKNAEENTPADDNRNCVPDNADKIDEHNSASDSTLRAIDYVDRIEKNTSINTSMDVSSAGIDEIDANSHIYDIDIMGVPKEIMTFNDVTNKVNKNTPVEEITNRESNDAFKLEECAAAAVRTNDLDKVVKQESTKRRTRRVMKVKPIKRDSPIKRRARLARNVVNKVEKSSSTGNVDHAQNTADEIKLVVPRVDTEMLVTSTTPNIPNPSSTTSPGTTLPSTTSSTLNNSKSCSPTKKMRQTTLTEFLSFSGKSSKQESFSQTEIKTEEPDETEANSSVSYRKSKRWKPVSPITPLSNRIVKNPALQIPTSSTPVLRMHMNPEAIIDLLNVQIKDEPMDAYDANVSKNSPYNLRRSKGSATPRTRSTKRRPRSIVSKQTPNAKMSLQEKLWAKYNCKDCVVRLERCDYISKRVVFKTDISTTTFQLAIGGETRRDSLSGKEQPNSSTIRIVNLDNCIVLEVLESR